MIHISLTKQVSHFFEIYINFYTFYNFSYLHRYENHSKILDTWIQLPPGSDRWAQRSTGPGRDKAKLGARPAHESARKRRATVARRNIS